MRLTEKVAVVTGGGNGIGAAIATRMAGEGAAVAVVDVDALGGKRVAAELPDASFHQCDVTDEDAVAALFADVRRPARAARRTGQQRGRRQA